VSQSSDVVPVDPIDDAKVRLKGMIHAIDTPLKRSHKLDVPSLDETAAIVGATERATRSTVFQARTGLHSGSESCTDGDDNEYEDSPSSKHTLLILTTV
jgi:hypothetical protein